MTGIWEYPNLDQLDDFIASGIVEAQNELSDEDVGGPVELIRGRQAFVIGEFGQGTGEIGNEPLEVAIIFRAEGLDQPSLNPQFDNTVRAIIQEFYTLINNNEVPTPDQYDRWFTYLDITPIPEDQRSDRLTAILLTGKQEMAGGRDSIYDLTNNQRVEYQEDTLFNQLPRTPQDEIGEEEEEDEEEDEDDGRLGVFEDDDEEEESEEEEEAVEESESETAEEILDVLSVNDDEIEVESHRGKQKVEKRDPYNFEVEMMAPTPQESARIRGIPFAAGIPVQAEVPDIIDEIRDELWDDTNFVFIGRALRSGGILVEEDEFAESTPFGTFPRTGIYIRNRLKYEGATYLYDLYKDLTYYTGMIRTFYDIDFTTATYQAFRTYMSTLRRISEEEEGPVLIEKMSQPQAASRGLEVVPDHPAIEGEKAPWLENRQYYMINTNADTHDAWKDPTGWYYDEDEQEGESGEQAG
jgi:hypothetical protein